ncbi:MAG TPA: D-alanyl-D-alanine carboxypeptidase, partial [Bacilli bacterium]
MRKLIRILLGVLVIVFVFSIGPVRAEEGEQEQELTRDARSAILIEPTTLEVIYEKNADEKLAPASLTKIMTMILVYDALAKGLISKDTV